MAQITMSEEAFAALIKAGVISENSQAHKVVIILERRKPVQVITQSHAGTGVIEACVDAGVFVGKICKDCASEMQGPICDVCEADAIDDEEDADATE